MRILGNKHMLFRAILGLITLCISVSYTTVMAQEASVVTSVSQNPTYKGNRIQVTVTLNNCTSNTGRVPMVQIPGLTFIGGPSSSHSQNWINGTKSSTHSYIYTFSVSSEKEILIPPIKIATSAGTLQSNRVIIKVLPRGTKTTSNSKKNSFSQLETIIEVSKSKVYIGEPVVLAYKIYNQHPGLEVREYNVPELKGFWKEEVKGAEARWEVQIINGKRYQVATVQRVIAFPQQTGTFTIDGFNLKGYIKVNFFSGQNIQSNSKSVKIEVLPLPEGKPQGFIGTFSNLSVSSKVQKDSVTVNEAFNFTVTYAGSGNLKLLREPQILWPSEFEVFNPEVNDKINITSAGEAGRRTFKYVVLPRAPGTYKLPEIELSYFNPKTKRYISTSTFPENIEIIRGTGDNNSSTTFSSKTDVQILNHDIRHINTAPVKWKVKHYDKWTEVLWLFWFLIGPTLALGAFFFRRKSNFEANDRKGTRNRKAMKALSRTLAKCSKISDKETAFTTLGEGLEVYLCSKLGWGRSEFSRSIAVDKLSDLIGEKESNAWDAILQKCEMARFAPGALPECSTSLKEAKRLADISDKQLIKSAHTKSINTIVLLVSFISIALLSSDVTLGNTNDFQELDSLLIQANTLYADGNYSDAAKIYENLAFIQNSFELEYNLGNVYYKLENIGESILHYERARLISPLDGDLRANLLLAELRAIDRIEPLPGIGIDRLISVIISGGMLHIWLLLTIITWTLAFLLIAIRLRWVDSIIHPFARIGATTSMILSIIFFVLLYQTHQRLNSNACGIIMNNRVEIRSMPGSQGVSLFQLHEGTRACLLSSEGDWTEIILENGNVGWLLTSAIEPI